MKESLIKELARDTGIPFSLVKEVVDSQSALVVKAMNESFEQGYCKKVRLPYLGTFTEIEGKIIKMKKDA